MAANYVQIIDTIEDVLQAALPEEVTVTQDISPPTVEQCPTVIVSMEGFEREPTFIARPQFGGSYVEKIRVTLDCWAFSGQGVQDAGVQRDILVNQVIQAVEYNPEIEGLVLMFQVLRGETMVSQGNGIHSGMRLQCEGQVIT